MKTYPFRFEYMVFNLSLLLLSILQMLIFKDYIHAGGFIIFLMVLMLPIHFLVLLNKKLSTAYGIWGFLQLIILVGQTGNPNRQEAAVIIVLYVLAILITVLSLLIKLRVRHNINTNEETIGEWDGQSMKEGE